MSDLKSVIELATQRKKTYKVSVSFNLDQEIAALVRQTSREYNIPMSTIVENAVREYLKAVPSVPTKG